MDFRKVNKNLPWKTGASTPRQAPLVWPTPIQIMGQLLIVLAVGGVWGVLLFGFLRLTETGQTEALASESATTGVVNPTVAPAQPVTATPFSTPTPRPSVTVAPTVSEPATEVSTSSPQPSTEQDESPTPLPQLTATASSLPTETPASPTEIPTAPALLSAGAVSFKNEVFPIFERRCIKCHGGVNNGEQRVEEGLKLTSYEEIMAGSMNGPVIEPGNVENSYLIEQIVTGKMPKKEPRLLPAEIRLITAWVEAGAPNN